MVQHLPHLAPITEPAPKDVLFDDEAGLLRIAVTDARGGAFRRCARAADRPWTPSPVAVSSW
ncbi:hypothetical protein [Streptomyces thermoalcalitolerans]|uniref:hypothetical protein n=1 Tax=Streptomyces thermoalcalitolerans TaxID=65605 RepID=UPI0031DC7006